MKFSAKAIIIPTLVLAIVCLAVTAALAGTNAITEDKIEQVQAEAAASARKEVLPDADTFDTDEEAPKNEEGEVLYYRGFKGDEVVGYVITTEDASGYGGIVKVMTGINTEGKVTGVSILSHSETPGLGANAEKEDFRSQYVTYSNGNTFELIKNQEPSEGQIRAMTGATITSTAVTNAVNSAVEIYLNSIQGGA